VELVSADHAHAGAAKSHGALNGAEEDVMEVRNRIVTATIVVLALAWAAPASAESGVEASPADAVATLANMVRWTGVAASLVVIGAAWLLLRFVSGVVSQLGVAFAENRLLFQKITAFVRFGVYLFTIVAVILLSFRISREVLAVLGGTAAVAIGFATKDLVSSLVAGVMIMFDRPFQVGDRVEFGGQYGDIVSIGLRSVKLRTLGDSIVTIPNNMLLNEVTSCGNYGEVNMQVQVDFLIGIDQEVERARSIVREAAVTSRYVHLPKPVDVLVEQTILSDYLALRLRLKAYVLDTQFEKAFATDVTLRVLEAFREAGIQPPAVLHRSLEAERPDGLRPVGAVA
jgi:small-conductance mechanosensitive channel